jgi:phosphatidylinositol-3,4,5-trisphosphate 5-phosphatase 2
LQRATQKVFFGFEEGEITFAPTYRYKRGTRDTYAYEKQKSSGIKINVPSWCDRVLWRTFPNTYIRQTSYGCTTDIVTSDHSPVFSTFDVGIANQYVRKHDSAAGTECLICFDNIDVR